MCFVSLLLVLLVLWSAQQRFDYFQLPVAFRPLSQLKLSLLCSGSPEFLLQSLVTYNCRCLVTHLHGNGFVYNWLGTKNKFEGLLQFPLLRMQHSLLLNFTSFFHEFGCMAATSGSRLGLVEFGCSLSHIVEQKSNKKKKKTCTRSVQFLFHSLN